MMRTMLAAAGAGLFAAAAWGVEYTEKIVDSDGLKIRFLSAEGVPTLSTSGAIPILDRDGFKFKDLNRNGSLEPYEDWRLDMRARAKDLAGRISHDELFGLMLYSGQLWIEQIPLEKRHVEFMGKNRIRHMLIAKVECPEYAAKWSNYVQAFAETNGVFGIPSNNSSDPRHAPVADAEYAAGAGGKISMWPGPIAMAATFSPALVREFAEIARREYRLLGIATALSPQADICTEPRWRRFAQTFGEGPALAADMTREYSDGFQTTPGAADGWGCGSVNAMVKHWPGGGPGESGRDAHFGRGKFAVYPGNGLEHHKRPFVEGAFALRGGTKMCSAVMPYYTLPVGLSRESVANGFNREIIQEWLRDGVGFDGVVCTDWGIVEDYKHPNRHKGKPWGMEYASVPERELKCWLAGVDQFGGINDIAPLYEAYKLGVSRYGEKAMDARVRLSAERLLRNIFRVGLFESAFVDPAEAIAEVGCAKYMKAGFEAQVKSVVMVKNRDGALPLKGGRKLKVWFPRYEMPAYTEFWGNNKKPDATQPFPAAIADKYFASAEGAQDADAAVVFMTSPISTWGYSEEDAAKGGNGYVPISLQYADYTATFARAHSIAGGDRYERTTDRTYRGKTVKTVNANQLAQLRSVREAMGKKPVILVFNVRNPAVPTEFEPLADAVLVVSDIQSQAILEVVSGAAEPSGLLPFQFPADMKTVEEQCEDLPFDMRPYVDAAGHAWDYAYGLNWSGVIDDERVRAYRPASSRR